MEVPAEDVGAGVMRSGFGVAWPILVALLTLGLAPMLLLNFVGQQNTRDRLMELGVANLTMRSASTAASIDSYLQSRKREIVQVSQIPDVIAYAQNLGDKGQRDLARTALAMAATADTAYESIAILSLDGTIVAASIQTDEGTNVRFRDYFQNARTGVGYVSEPSYSVITNKPALFFSAPVRTTDGILVGVVRSRINLARIWDLVESDLGAVGAGAHAFLVDDYGIRLAVSETKGNRDKADSLIYKVIAPIEHDTALRLANDKRFGQKSAEQLVVDPLPELKAVIDSTARKGATTLTFDAGGVEQRAVATWLESKPWIYVVAMPPSSYLNAVAGPSTGFLGAVAMAVALTLVIATWVVRWILRSQAEAMR